MCCTICKEVEKLAEKLADLVRPSAIQNQLTLMEAILEQMLNHGHELYVLANKISWKELEKEFDGMYSHTGRSAHPIRRMVGFLMLKQLFEVSDEIAVRLWVENPYWQYFTGEVVFQKKAPMDPSELVHFRKRIGAAGSEKILKATMLMNGKAALEEEVIVDTTVQEKNITFPTDSKLYVKVIRKCKSIAQSEGITLRQTYTRKVKKLVQAQRFRRHSRNFKQAERALRKLRTIAGRMVRDVERKLNYRGVEGYEKDLGTMRRIVKQKRQDKDKVYSLHEPEVSCIAKGKEHKPYEFGSKVSIVMTRNTGIIVGAMSFQGNPHDSKTLEPALKQVNALTGKVPRLAIADKGYRGRKKIGETEIFTPQKPTKDKSQYQKRKEKARARRRSAIEPVISHLKHSFGMLRNYLKGTIGDAFNVRMAAAAWNLRKYLRKLGFFVPDFIIVILRGVVQWIDWHRPCWLRFNFGA